jgi:hypothetical protein
VQLWSNRIYANGGQGTRFNHGVYYGNGGSDDGSVQNGAVGGVIANNVFYDQPAGFHLQIGPQANGLIVTNNTFTTATARDPGSAVVVWGSGHQYSTKNVVVVNNVVAFNVYMGIRGSGSGSGSVVRNNLGYANPGGDFATSSTYSLGSGNITGLDPKFVDRGAHNYRVQDGSPVIDRADPAYAPASDADGRGRHGAPDLGAFEHQG